MSVYPELVGVIGSRVPDYRGRFLRGLQSGHSVGQTVANSLKSHNHTQPTHTHSFSGQLVSTALNGTAAGQSFSSAANLGVSGWAAGQSITSGGAGGQSFSYQGSTSSSSGGYVTFRHDTGTTNGYGAGGIIPGYSATPPTASWGITITENNGVFYSKYSSGSTCWGLQFSFVLTAGALHMDHSFPSASTAGMQVVFPSVAKKLLFGEPVLSCPDKESARLVSSRRAARSHVLPFFHVREAALWPVPVVFWRIRLGRLLYPVGL